MRRRIAEIDGGPDGPNWVEVCSRIPDSVAVYAGDSLIGFNETAAHEYLSQFGDDCGAECRAAGHLIVL